MKILSIIVTYNGRALIKDCIESISASQYPSDILVIDNNSTDQTIEMIQSISERVIIRKLSTNIGFGRANNIGLSYALAEGYDCVFLLNQDAWIRPDCLDLLVKCAEKNPEAGIISPLHLTPDAKSLDPNHGYHIFKLSGVDYTPELLMKMKEQTSFEIKFTNAAAWFIPRKFLTIVGGFDPLFFLYGEDDDLNNRRIFHGLKFLLMPAAKIYHIRATNPSNSNTQISPLSFANKTYSLNIAFLKNINSSFFILSFVLPLKVFKRILINLFSGNYNKIKTEINSYFRSLRMSKIIIDNRNICKRDNSSFLNPTNESKYK